MEAQQYRVVRYYRSALHGNCVNLSVSNTPPTVPSVELVYGLFVLVMLRAGDR
jgi:hypothetical protein